MTNSISREKFPKQKKEVVQPEPRWPSAVSLLAIVGLNFALPDALLFVPRWVLGLVAVSLLVPLVWLGWKKDHERSFQFGFVVGGFETLALVGSVWLLVNALPKGILKPVALLESAALLWLTNILVFASWYWRLDANGPHAREEIMGHKDGDLLLPQMTLDKTEHPEAKDWAPQFVDYLFVAFNTSTAFSPTDAPVLSRWAKVLTMIQSLISLTIIALLAARAVNILG